MKEGDQAVRPDSKSLASWNLFFTAVIAGIFLGQQYVTPSKEKQNSIYHTLIAKLQQELAGERTMITELKTEIKLQQRATNKAENRVSAMMSRRLRDGNPNIVDLSDQNRPMKLGEQFAELYDNQWTDAYSVLQNIFNGDEHNIINFLLDILKFCFKVCQERAEDQLKRLRKGAEDLESVITKKHTKLPDDLMQRIKEERKLSSSDKSPEYKEVLLQLKKYVSSSIDIAHILDASELKDYIQECLRLSWLMVIQDPPMIMLLEPGEKDIDNFKPYKKRGTKVDFVVWPTLLLHEGGELVMKGTVKYQE